VLVPYADDLPMREARRRYFEVNRFGGNGGYDDAWVDFKLGPIPFPFPNSPARVRAVRYHDLHHVLTGYDTDIVGEFEISAWEIAAGCKGFAAAWALNLGGTAAGLLRAPRRVFAAFVRGRRCRTLYGEPLDALLDETVGALRARYVATDAAPATSGDFVAFAASVVAGFTVGTLLFGALLPLVPVGLVMGWLHRRSVARA
jgi:hypothetical protein